MTRLYDPPDRETLDPADRDAYDHVLNGMRELMARPEWQGGQAPPPAEAAAQVPAVGGYYGALLTSPPLARLLFDMSRFFRSCEARGAFPAAFRELTNVVLAVELGYRGVLPGHVPFALAVGVRPEAISAVLTQTDDAFSDDERLQVEVIRAIVRGRLDDARFARLGDLLGRRGALEYTAFVCYLMHHIRLMQAIGVPEPPAAEVDAVLAQHLAG